MKHIVFFSGGVGSYGAAKAVVEKHGAKNVSLLFTDTHMEDEDLYRFLDESASYLGAELIEISDGRDPWEVFHDVKFLGNTRIDPCSRVLKRDLAKDYVTRTYQAHECTLYIGIDWTEQHRLGAVQKNWHPYVVKAPLCEPPEIEKRELFDHLKQIGIAPPRLYDMGFAHNNCGGFCIKAGHGQFAILLKNFPDLYAMHEAKEREFREFIGKDVSILRDRTGGTTKPLTMERFRLELEKGNRQVDVFDQGGCGCFV